MIIAVAAPVLLMGVAFGLAGGLVVSRIGVKKGYGQLPFFVVGFVVVFASSFLGVMMLVIVGAFFCAGMTKFPSRGPTLGVPRGKPKQKPKKSPRA